MRPATRPPLARIAFIDREIRQGSFPNAGGLARSLEVAHRTVQRDLQFLRYRLGAPLEFDARRNGFFYANPTFKLPLLQIGEGELLALFLAERVLQQYSGTPYAADITAAFQKITAFLPDSVTIDLQHLDQAFSIRQHAANPGDAEQFRKLSRAVKHRRQLELIYWSASRDDTAKRIVDPFHLASVDGSWYLVGFCHLREEIRSFSPQRIRGLRETGKTFDRPADFNIAAYLDAGFRKMRGNGPPQVVRLRFTPESARYVREKTWHPTQKLEAQPDGSLILEFRVNHLLEVKRFALSFGGDCTVLEPASLRTEIATEAAQISAKHR